MSNLANEMILEFRFKILKFIIAIRKLFSNLWRLVFKPGKAQVPLHKPKVTGLGQPKPSSSVGNQVIAGRQRGSVILKSSDRGAHEWRISTNGGVDHTNLPPTPSGTTSIAGLQPLTKVWQSNRRLLAEGRFSDWTPWVSGMVP